MYLAPERHLRMAVKRGWTRLVSAARPRYRFGMRRRRRHTKVEAPKPVPITAPHAAIDPVALTVLAVNRLGPATLRSVANGKPQTVTVPDTRTGEIFRAALAEMQKTRITDRLIDIVIDDDSANARRSLAGA